MPDSETIAPPTFPSGPKTKLAEGGWKVSVGVGSFPVLGADERYAPAAAPKPDTREKAAKGRSEPSIRAPTSFAMNRPAKPPRVAPKAGAPKLL